MGYTHHWEQKKPCPPKQWSQITTAFRIMLAQDLIEANGSGNFPIQFESDDPRSPQIDAEIIRFNGIGSAGHETFSFENIAEQVDYSWDFCKTARKPYDLAVTVVLVLAGHFAPGVWKIDSDGSHVGMLSAQELIKAYLGLDTESPIND